MRRARRWVGIVGLVACVAAVGLPTVAATHALVVGVGRYADTSIKTLKADVDAEVVATTLEGLGASVTKLLNEEATKTAILGWFSTVPVCRGDLVYIYLSGQGGSVPDPSGRAAELGALYPYDVKMNTLGGLWGGATADSAITENDLTYGISERLKGCHVVVFLDSCKSGLIAREDPAGDSQLVVRGEGAFVPRGLASGVRDPDDPGMTFVFASSDEHEPSFEDPKSEPPHGLFTRSLLNGLVCDADIAPADGTITYSELKAHVIRNMAELSESPARRGYVQTPVVLCSPEAPESENFVLARQACQLTIRSTESGPQSAVAVEQPREEGDDELVVFPDPALGRAVRKAVHKAEGEPITKGECRSVRWLIAAGKEIASLAGLEALTGLMNLDLSSNQIADISPLAGLRELEWVDLSGNQIVDLAALAGLTQLIVLDLSDNLIVDVTPLAGLTGLTELNLSRNKVAELTPLSGLPVFPEIGWKSAAGRTMVFASSSEHEPAFEDPSSSPPHGLFTQALVDGLLCAADSDLDGVVTYSEMAEYLTETMAQRTASLQGPGRTQTPVSTGAPDDDETSAFPICSTLCGTAVQTAVGTHALVVGVGVYQDPSFVQLKADLDAEVFAETLRDLGVAHVTLLTNERATRQEIGMWFIRVAPQPGDTIYIYLAGHGGGIADRSGREAEIGAFFPYDAQSTGAAWDRGDVVEESVISEQDLSTWVATYLSDCNVVLFIDASRSALLAR